LSSSPPGAPPPDGGGAASFVGPLADPEETALLADPRLAESLQLFNSGDWYASHDGFEALWHETQGPLRPVLQGILQIAVAHIHLERGNLRGATVLLGEGLGRLLPCGDQALGCNLQILRQQARDRLEALQAQRSTDCLPLPRLEPISPHPPR
jgi:predicted metal-dependent hydrolase